ncbi:MAG TPA: tetratricopeptide repeat protein [Candidatus Nitrosotalea sp.]|nr:tetratricopeptide repeat protein [Candidatus Nitrosotalea sp.]
MAAWSVPLEIALVTVLVFLPVLRADWVDWDDPTNFLDNSYYRGLGWPQLRWMMSATLMGHWIPVTWLTLGADYAIWGMNPFGYHLTSVILHALSAALFYQVAWRLLQLAAPAAAPIGRGLGAAAAALFFAIHPLRVESVAWITERRDLTSGLFFLLTIWCYLKAHERRETVRAGWRLAALVAAALALGSKSIVMGLPLVLVILDVYPLRRLGPVREWLGASARPVWIEKIPFLVLTVAVATVAYTVQRHTGYLTAATPSVRLAMTGYSICFHVWKTFAPLNLSPIYEMPPQLSLIESPYLPAVIAAIAVTVAVWLARRRWPAGLAVWATYLVLLAPVSGLAHTGYHLGADRNTYLSCASFAVLVGALVLGIAETWRRRSLQPAIAVTGLGLCALWIIGLGLSARVQTAVWRDSETLWRYAVEIDPACSVCQHNLGISVGRRGHYAEGLAAFGRAIALRPDRSEFRGNYGLLLMQMGRRAEGLAALRYRLADSPGDLVTRRNLALALIEDGRPEEAITELETVLRTQPDSVSALDTLGRAHLIEGRVEPAMAAFRHAIAVSPSDPVAHLGLARAYLAGGDRTAAREQLGILRTIDPRLAGQVEQEFR